MSASACESQNSSAQFSVQFTTTPNDSSTGHLPHDQQLALRNRSAKAVCQAVFALILVLLSACSARQAYDAMAENQRTQCLRRPPSQQADCMAQTRISYEEYLRQRREATGAK